jgi:thiol-disulfide isomerase/thioredoxin
MLKTNIEKGLLVLVASLAFAGAVVFHAMQHSKGTAGQAQAAMHGVAAFSPFSAPGSSASPAVIRFVKDPESAPAFRAQDLSGRTISTDDFKGKVVLLNFWATWCPPCREEIPELISLQTQYKDRLQIIGVSEDDDPPEKVAQFVQKAGMNYPVVMASEQITDAYGGVPALPTSFVIDPQGRVVQRHTGEYPIDTYIQEVRALLGLPVAGRIETFADTGQVFLQNAANATDLPDVDFSGLTPEQKKTALHRLNAEGCTCGCKLTLAECRINDTSCPVSKALAAQVVKEVASGSTPKQQPASSGTAKPSGN